jgi:hypothetical protein
VSVLNEDAQSRSQRTDYHNHWPLAAGRWSLVVGRSVDCFTIYHAVCIQLMLSSNRFVLTGSIQTPEG